MDKNVTAAYIKDRFDPADRIAIVIIDRKPTLENKANSPIITQRITTAGRAMSDEYQSMLRYQNAQRNDIYLGMNPLRDDARSRMKEDVREVKHVYLDFDEDGITRVNKMLGAIEDDKPKYEMPIPHAIVNTSPGKYQTIWNVEGFSQIQAEKFMALAAREFGADIAVTDSARVLRLPGFYNYKPEFAADPTERRPKALVTVQSRDGRPLTPGDFPSIHERELAPVRVSRNMRVQTGGVIDQSSRDFAWARRQLERGWEPHRIEAAIAEYRTRVAPGKHPDLDKYARNTVEAALRKGHSRDTISR